MHILGIIFLIVSVIILAIYGDGTDNDNSRNMNTLLFFSSLDKHHKD